MSRSAEGILRGWHVALMAGGAFGVVLAVNAALAFFAVRTFSGVVVDDSYVASRHFNAERDAQEALGWTATLTAVDGIPALDFVDAGGNIVRPADLAVTLGRPTTDRDDMSLTLARTPRGYAGTEPLAPGAWRVEIRAVASDGTTFRQSRSLLVRERG